jgi:viroplasmin and RNaseH domain-containing protein
MFKVHTGYSRCGKSRYKRFDTIEDASAYCNYVFARVGIVLSIEKE